MSDSAALQASGRRIVLTGGPGGGKTTAADLFRRELGERVVLVPEAATLIFSGGFPRHSSRMAVRAAQRAIFFVQRGLEDTQAAAYPGRILLCDRGTVDGAAYWPDGPRDGASDPQEFFAEVGTTLAAELSRYDAVLHFESAAVGGIDIEGGNPVRNESIDDAVRLDRRLRELYEAHPRQVVVPHSSSFFDKISLGFTALEGIVARLSRQR